MMTKLEQADEIDWIETNKALAKEIIELKKQAEQSHLADATFEPVAWSVDGVLFWTDEMWEEWYSRNPEPLYAAPVSIESAVLAEREKCAKVCEDDMGWLDNGGGELCAKAIRARGDK